MRPGEPADTVWGLPSAGHGRAGGVGYLEITTQQGLVNGQASVCGGGESYLGEAGMGKADMQLVRGLQAKHATYYNSL